MGEHLASRNRQDGNGGEERYFRGMFLFFCFDLCGVEPLIDPADMESHWLSHTRWPL